MFWILTNIISLLIYLEKFVQVADFGIALFFPDADVTHLTKSVVGTEV